MATAMAALACPAGASATIHVTNTNDSGPGSLRQAIADAGFEETIDVPAGTITLTTGELVINRNVTIAGAGPARTILSAGNSGRVLLVLGASRFGLSGVTVRDGVLTGPTSIALRGVGLLALSAPVTITNSLFTANRIDNDGAIGSPGGTVQGAAIYAGGPLTLIDTRVAGNSASADGGSGGGGGAVRGGAVYTGGTLTVTHAQLSGNRASADGGAGGPGGTVYGGALDSVGSATISGADISGNTATARGGRAGMSSAQVGGTVIGAGAQLQGGTELTSSTASANHLDVSGGPGASGGNGDGAGLTWLSDNPDDSMTNVTIASNSMTTSAGGALIGGGLFLEAEGSGSVRLTNDTLAGNSVDQSVVQGVGNFFSYTAAGADVQAANLIVSDGVGLAGSANCSINGVFTSLGHNIDSRNECHFVAGTDRVNTDPGLEPLADNGGPGPTKAFAATSPAFDAGDPGTCPATDERGVNRPRGAACDIGAFELQLADLAIRSAARRAGAPIGSLVTFTLTGANAGGDAARLTTITARLPNGLALTAATPTVGSCAGLRTVVCSLGDLAPGQSGTVTIAVRATRAGRHAISTAVASGTADPNRGDNASATAVKVAPLAVSSLRIRPRRFRLGSSGSTISFKLPEPAKVRLVFARRGHGRRAVTMRGHVGRNVRRFRTRLRRHMMPTQGRYRITVTARDVFGNESRPVTRRITATG